MSETLQLDLFWMTLLIFVPGLFAVGLLFFRKGSEEGMRWWALTGTVGAFGLALGVLVLFNYQVLQFLNVPTDRDKRARVGLPHRLAQLDLAAPAAAPDAPPSTKPQPSDDWVARMPWIPQFDVNYSVGVDGINLALVLLTTTVFVLAVLASWSQTRYVRGFLALLLLLETAVLGTLLALDFLLLLAFWGLTLVPLYFLLGVWGEQDRVAASLRFFLFGFTSVVLVLLAAVALYFADVRDFVAPEVVEAEARRLARDDQAREPEEVRLQRARDVVAIHTFDLTTLHRAGRTAAQVLAERDVPADKRRPLTGVPALRPIEERLAKARRAKAPTATIEGIEKELTAAEGVVRERLAKEPFFQPWYQYTVFGLLFVGFAILLPVVPLHSWWPLAAVEAPTPVSMILGGVFLKLGGYGLLRVAWPICPWPAEQLAWWLALLGVVSIVYGALAALAQDDLKKLVAYAAVSGMGFVLLGLASWTTAERAAYWSWGANGALYQMVGQGVAIAGLFFLVGVVAERVKHRRLELMGGLGEPMPVTAGLAVVVFFTALGVPGLAGFVGQLMVIVGAWNASPLLAGLVVLSLLVTAGCVLWTLQRIFMGSNQRFKNVEDATPLEAFTGTLLAALCLLLGVVPMWLLGWMEPSVTALVDTLVRPG